MTAEFDFVMACTRHLNGTGGATMGSPVQWCPSNQILAVAEHVAVDILKVAEVKGLAFWAGMAL